MLGRCNERVGLPLNCQRQEVLPKGRAGAHTSGMLRDRIRRLVPLTQPLRQRPSNEHMFRLDAFVWFQHKLCLIQIDVPT